MSAISARFVELLAGVGPQVPTYARLPQHLLGPAVDQRVRQRVLGHLPEQQRRTSQPPDPQLTGGEPDAAREAGRQCSHLAGQPGWEVVERLAGQQHQAADPLVEPVGGEEQPTAPVGVDQGDVAQVERLEQLGQQVDQPAQGEVRTRPHRHPVRPERQHRAQVAEACGKQGQHAVPLGVVHQQPVQQHDRRPAAGLVVLHDALAQLDLLHDTTSPGTITLERSLYHGPVETRDRIVQAMAELLRAQGYGSTGIKQLSAASGAPTGSIYHHFPGGKREVAATALRTTGSAYVQLVPLLLDPYDDLVAGVEAFFSAAAEDLESTGWANLCPVGTVTGEVADSEPGLREVAAEVIGSWVEQGTTYLAGRGLEESAARGLTYALLGALEGAFILCRGLRSAEPMRAAGRGLAAYVAALSTLEPSSPGRHANS